MSRFHWTTESFGYALRDSRNYARCCITRGKEGGFYGLILASGLPDSGPYKSRKEAAEWVQRMAVQLEHLPADSEFSDVPGVSEKAAA